MTTVPTTGATYTAPDPRRESHSLRLRRKIALSLPMVVDAVRTLEQAPLRALYVKYLLHLHSTMRASVPLMERTVAACRARPGDELCHRIADYLEAHIPEERGHDEWVIHDLGALGVSRAEVADYLPSTAAAALIGTITYYVEHVHPVAEMGYIAFAEGYPMSEPDVERWQEMTGLPPEAFTCLRKHAVIDRRHRADFDAALDQMPLQGAHERLLGVSALHTANAVAAGLHALVERVSVARCAGRPQ